MTIEKRLFAAAVNADIHAALSTPEAIVAAAVAEGSVSRLRAHIRLHWFDRTKAAAWLAECASPRFSAEAINVLPPADQNARVIELWTAFGNFWQSLNVCPYGWARWRRLCEKAWGYPSYAPTADGWKGKRNQPLYNGAYGGQWRDAAHNAIYRPIAPQAAHSVAYGSSNSSVFWTGNGNPNFGPTDVIFGDPSVYAEENAGGRPGTSNFFTGSAFAPTVEVHRIWMQRNGSIYGGYPNGLNQSGAQTSASGLNGNLDAYWRGYNFTPGNPAPINSGNVYDWNTGFVLPDPRGTNIARQTPNATGDGGAWEHRAMSLDVQWTFVPLRQYWSLLRDPIGPALGQLMTGPDDRDATHGGDPASTEAHPMSVIDYLRSKTIDEIIREVFLDVVIRNDTMARMTFQSLDQLVTAGEREDLRRQQEAQQGNSTINAIVGVASLAVGGLVSTALTPAAGLAIGGAATQVGRFFAMFGASHGIEDRRTDIFGRLFPLLESLAISESEESVTTSLALIDMPNRSRTGPSVIETATIALGVPLTMELPEAVMASLQLNSSTHGIFRIIGMPPAGQIEMGQDRRAPSCRWEGNAQDVYSCGAPFGGNFWLRITSPAGETRIARTGVAQGTPTDVTWASMFREHHYAIAGLPPNTAVFVDGAPAMGTWSDAAMSEWQVFMPQGPHDVRLVAPGMAPVLVTVNAQGDASHATWAALQTAGVQQRQTAEGGSGVGMWVAGVVGLGAVAIFLATVMLDGKPAPKRNPRRK